ncbi:MAG TPA: CHY zinc finger protein [Candidatus Elarobacter sp.]|nr:CHY zinc finger protein [Candidatus Elarobacter sp.]
MTDGTDGAPEMGEHRAAGPRVEGIGLDAETRCAHYASPVDVIAIKAPCCDAYYACAECHVALAGHSLAVWERERWGERAVLCGKCRAELTVEEYLGANDRCPRCGTGFNPGCRTHHHLYFAT